MFYQWCEPSSTSILKDFFNSKLTHCMICILFFTWFITWLTHWGRVRYICIRKVIIIGSDNDLSPGWCQAIIWTNAGILLIEPLGNKLQWNLNQNFYFFIQENAFEHVVWKMATIVSQPQCVNGLINYYATLADSSSALIRRISYSWILNAIDQHIWVLPNCHSNSCPFPCNRHWQECRPRYLIKG